MQKKETRRKGSNTSQLAFWHFNDITGKLMNKPLAFLFLCNFPQKLKL